MLIAWQAIDTLEDRHDRRFSDDSPMCPDTRAGSAQPPVHDYLGIDVHEVWRTVSNELPALERLLRDAIESR